MLKQEIAWFDDKRNGTGTLCSRLSTDAAAVQGVRIPIYNMAISSKDSLYSKLGYRPAYRYDCIIDFDNGLEHWYRNGVQLASWISCTRFYTVLTG